MNRNRSGFTLVEIMVVIMVIGILTSMLIPALSAGKSGARDILCRNNLRQLGQAALLYCEEYDGFFMPLAYSREWPVRYWWGTNARPMDYTKGFIYPCLGATSKSESVLECPEQPFGTYIPQGPGKQLTSTYGYNGYYLCPSATPGWEMSIGFRPWGRQGNLTRTEEVFMFADTLVDWGGRAGNNCLLDPPLTFSGGSWKPNPSPTTCFRHSGRANVCFVDGHVESMEPNGGEMTSPALKIGSCGSGNTHYVPDWQDWEQPR